MAAQPYFGFSFMRLSMLLFDIIFSEQLFQESFEIGYVNYILDWAYFLYDDA